MKRPAQKKAVRKIGYDTAGAAAGGGGASIVVIFSRLWSNLSFIPGTAGVSYLPALTGVVAGIIFDEYFKARFQGKIRRLFLGLGAAVVFVVSFIGYREYVMWVTKSLELVESRPAHWGQYLILFVAAFSWSLLWAVAGRGVANLLAPRGE